MGWLTALGLGLLRWRRGGILAPPDTCTDRSIASSIVSPLRLAARQLVDANASQFLRLPPSAARKKPNFWWSLALFNIHQAKKDVPIRPT